MNRELLMLVDAISREKSVDRDVVFGAVDMKAGATGSLYHLGSDPRLNHEYPVVAGVLGDECGALLTGWFQSRRGAVDPTI